MSCACMGPQNGEPLCPCQMRAARQHISPVPYDLMRTALINSTSLVAEMVPVEELRALRAENARLKSERLKLDRRIRNQRIANRETWQIVEQRRKYLWSDSARKFALRYGHTVMDRNAEIDRLRAALDGMVKCFDPAALTNPPESVFVRNRLEAARAALSKPNSA